MRSALYIKDPNAALCNMPTINRQVIQTPKIKGRSRDRMTEIKFPLEKGKWETHSCRQSIRIIKSCWKGTVETPSLPVVRVPPPAHLAAVASAFWEGFFCPLSPTATSEADAGEYTFLGPPQLPRSASCWCRFIGPGAGMICHRVLAGWFSGCFGNTIPL